MAVLYRKYRPQTFAQLAGQEHIAQTLKNQVVLGQVAHAYLFTGSRGIGKTSVARIFAKAINCEGDLITGDSCGKCEVCKQIEAGNFLDLVEIDAASNTGVDNIRELIEHVRFAPSRARYKVFIIDEVHMLSKGAFNALLKTLEEPPKHAVFILATTEIGKVPVTIISRTQRFDFKRLSTEQIFEQLQTVLAGEGQTIDEKVLRLLASHAEGSLRDALSLLGKVLTLGQEATLANTQELLGFTDIGLCQNLLEIISQGQTEVLPEFFDGLLERGLDFTALNRDFLEYLRKVLIYKISGQDSLINLDAEYLLALKKLSESLASPAEIIYIIRLFLKAFKDLSSSPSPEIPLLLAALEAALRQKSAGKAAAKPASLPANLSSVQTPANNISAVNRAEPIQESVIIENQTIAMELPEFRVLWPKIISAIKAINSPLANTLRSCEVVNINNGRVLLSAKFLFHKQSLENQKNFSLILEQMHKVSGERLSFAIELNREDSSKNDAKLSLTDALKIFGGEIIE